MLSERSSVDIHALHRQGITISEIARRTYRSLLGYDRNKMLIEMPNEAFHSGYFYARITLSQCMNFQHQHQLTQTRLNGVADTYCMAF